MSSRSAIDTGISDASTGIQTRYTASDWPPTSIFSGMGNFSGLQLITRRSATSGNRSAGAGAEGSEMETITRSPTVG